VDACWYLLDTITALVIVKTRLDTTMLAAKGLVIAAQLQDKLKRTVTNLMRQTPGSAGDSKRFDLYGGHQELKSKFGNCIYSLPL
jgi:hypothetical protein